MSLAPSQPASKILGRFQHYETLCRFEYMAATRWPESGCEFEIYVGPNANETRLARILKTVAYVAIDEDEFGNPVFEKWPLYNHKKFSQD